MTRSGSAWEVDRQAKPLAGETEIRQKLLLVDRSDQLDGFDFDDNLIFDDQIGLESGIDADILIDHRNRLLAHVRKPRQPSSIHTPRPFDKRISASPGQASHECGKRRRRSPWPWSSRS